MDSITMKDAKILHPAGRVVVFQFMDASHEMREAIHIFPLDTRKPAIVRYWLVGAGPIDAYREQLVFPSTVLGLGGDTDEILDRYYRDWLDIEIDEGDPAIEGLDHMEFHDLDWIREWHRRRDYGVEPTPDIKIWLKWVARAYTACILAHRRLREGADG